MKIIKTDLEDAFTGICEQCKKETKVRRIQTVGMFHEDRGYFNLCFDCYTPQVYFKSRSGVICHAPMKKEKGTE